MAKKIHPALSVFLVILAAASFMVYSAPPAMSGDITEEHIGDPTYILRDGVYTYDLYAYPSTRFGIYLPAKSTVSFKIRYGKFFNLEFYAFQGNTLTLEGDEIIPTFDVWFLAEDQKTVLGHFPSLQVNFLHSMPHKPQVYEFGKQEDLSDQYCVVKIKNKGNSNKDIKFYVYVPRDREKNEKK
jgi:hypothetical protein